MNPVSLEVLIDPREPGREDPCPPPMTDWVEDGHPMKHRSNTGPGDLTLEMDQSLLLDSISSPSMNRDKQVELKVRVNCMNPLEEGLDGEERGKGKDRVWERDGDELPFRQLTVSLR